jgi:tRNA(Ile)-lysidine synthase TilS/MesJ
VARGGNLTIPATITTNLQKSQDLLTKNEEINHKIDEKSDNLNRNIADISKNYNDLLKKKNEQPVKEKTDRELQYYESPECENIKAQCTKEQALNWLKDNPGVDFKQMDKDLGLGNLKWIVELYNENLIETCEMGWKVK